MNIIDNIRIRLLERNEYKIISHEELLNANNFNKIKFSEDYKISNAFHLISNDTLITSFVIKNKKIISLTTNLVKTKEQIRTPLTFK